MSKPAKRRAKRGTDDSPTGAGVRRDLPSIPQRYSQRGSARLFQVRHAELVSRLERDLAPPRADGWIRAGDPTDRVRVLLAQSRTHAAARRYPAALETLAEARRVFWDNQVAIREARERAELRAVKVRWLETAQAGTRARRTAAAERQRFFQSMADDIQEDRKRRGLPRLGQSALIVKIQADHPDAPGRSQLRSYLLAPRSPAL